ncbi:G5 domain-containing protein [Facklamia hominis]
MLKETVTRYGLRKIGSKLYSVALTSLVLAMLPVSIAHAQDLESDNESTTITAEAADPLEASKPMDNLDTNNLELPDDSAAKQPAPLELLAESVIDEDQSIPNPMTSNAPESSDDKVTIDQQEYNTTDQRNLFYEWKKPGQAGSYNSDLDGQEVDLLTRLTLRVLNDQGVEEDVFRSTTVRATVGKDNVLTPEKYLSQDQYNVQTGGFKYNNKDYRLLRISQANIATANLLGYGVQHSNRFFAGQMHHYQNKTNWAPSLTLSQNMNTDFEMKVEEGSKISDQDKLELEVTVYEQKEGQEEVKKDTLGNPIKMTLPFENNKKNFLADSIEYNQSTGVSRAISQNLLSLYNSNGTRSNRYTLKARFTDPRLEENYALSVTGDDEKGWTFSISSSQEIPIETQFEADESKDKGEVEELDKGEVGYRLGNQIQKDMRPRRVKVGVRDYISEEEVIAKPETVIEEDPNLPRGQEKIIPGREGRKEVQYEVIYELDPATGKVLTDKIKSKKPEGSVDILEEAVADRKIIGTKEVGPQEPKHPGLDQSDKNPGKPDSSDIPSPGQQPGETPDNPGTSEQEKPDQSGSKDQPQPDQPNQKPGQSDSQDQQQPDQPDQKPGQSDSQDQQQPDQSGQQPDQSDSKDQQQPDQPGQKPGQPGSKDQQKPDQPGQKPGQSDSKDQPKPGQSDSKDQQKPDQSGQKPGQSGSKDQQKTDQSGQKPAQPGSKDQQKPDQSGQLPGQSDSHDQPQPDQSGQKPGQSGSKDQQKPDQSGQKPGQSGTKDQPKPDQSGQKPSQPGSKDQQQPDQPGQKPNQSGSKDQPQPDQPNQKPGQSDYQDQPQPDQPDQKPGQSDSQDQQQPDQPGQKPGQSDSKDQQKPDQPGQTPGQSDSKDQQKPAQPNQKPDQPGQKSGQSGTKDQPKPDQPGQKPNQSGSKDQQKPDQPDQNPGQSGSKDQQKPDQPGQKPGQSGSKDQQKPDQPGQNPGQPGSTDQQKPDQPGKKPELPNTGELSHQLVNGLAMISILSGVGFLRRQKKNG